MKKNKEDSLSGADPTQPLEISRQIRQEAEEQAQDIVRRAKQEAERILAAARQASAAERQAKMMALEQELEKTKQRIFASLHLEERRIFLREQDRFINEVLQEARRLAEKSRSSPEYMTLLGKTILEGALVLDQAEVRVVYSSLDQKICTDEFFAGLEKMYEEKTSKKVRFLPEKGDFTDIGVKVYSRDGRISFDNTSQPVWKGCRTRFTCNFLKASSSKRLPLALRGGGAKLWPQYAVKFFG